MSDYPRFGPCLCGGTDCKSCGPAQGYRLDGDDAEHGDDRDEDAERGMATLQAEGFDLGIEEDADEPIPTGEATESDFSAFDDAAGGAR